MNEYSPNWIEIIINTVVALAAAGAAIFGGLTWRQAKKFKDNENKSRRAYIAPETIPGTIQLSQSIEEPYGIYDITLKNYGTNSASNIEVILFGYNEADIEGVNSNPSPIFQFKTSSFNPIPSSSDLKLTFKSLSRESFNFEMLLTGYLAMYVKYNDEILGQQFTDCFYWKPDDNKVLSEIKPKEYQILSGLLQKEIEKSINA